MTHGQACSSFGSKKGGAGGEGGVHFLSRIPTHIPSRILLVLLRPFLG